MAKQHFNVSQQKLARLTVQDDVSKPKKEPEKGPEKMKRFQKTKISSNGELGSGQEHVKHKIKARVKDQLPTIQEVERNVLENIIGQDQQVREIITAIYRSITFKSIKSNVLIIGNSGTGKTETIKQIAKQLNLPYTIEDATKYTKEGYYGNNVEDMIYNLLQNADNNIKKAQRGIIVIDEIDKKAGHDSRDVGGVAVLKSLLKLIEGTTFKVDKPGDIFGMEDPIDFDTKDLIIIFSGAFSGLNDIRSKRLNTKKMGFVASEEINPESLSFQKEDLIKYGLPDEFVGRIDTIIQMNVLTKADLKNIVSSSKLSIFNKYQSELNQNGIQLIYDDDIFDTIAEKSYKANTGAREISNIVNKMFESIVYDVMANPGKYKRCKISPETVSDNTRYELS